MADLKQQLTELLSQGDRIGAIRALRKQHGLGLADAKAALERFESMGDLPKAPSAPPALPDEVRELAAKGQVIEAIKLLRARTGMGLAEAKALVDSAPRPAKKSGCGTALVFLTLGCIGWLASS